MLGGRDDVEDERERSTTVLRGLRCDGSDRNRFGVPKLSNVHAGTRDVCGQAESNQDRPLHTVRARGNAETHGAFQNRWY